MSFGLYLMYYYATFIGIAVAALMYVGCDGFMFNVALHVCGQFEVLNTSVEEWSDVSNYLEQRQIIGEYCKRHDRLLRLNSQTAHLVKSIILCDLFSNAFLICISGMAIVINIRIGNAEKDIVTLAIRIFICYVGIFMYSYVGEILYSQAQKLRISIYNCPWYNMPVSIAKDINFIIMRSNSICTLTAGGVYVMNLESFKNITKLIFSYFSVLKLMFE
ncbi:odorant receptor 30a-like [Fopius arisanus]|uniref:Odorant receptor 30a-like n=1 Tax=Fopius arisanus TaxID=64838 RepID=A0A9R1TWS3_9HYME|nr:PREDICTED: odorant receptor 30a-like [Fopius arisanus]